MKEHKTIKSIKKNWNKVYYCGYCDLQYIMSGVEPQYYNAGIYGWNCDIYCDALRDIAITTGYRNMTGVRIPDEIIEKYSKIAQNILADARGTSWSIINEALENNRDNFFDELR